MCSADFFAVFVVVVVVALLLLLLLLLQMTFQRIWSLAKFRMEVPASCKYQIIMFTLKTKLYSQLRL